MLAWKSMSEDKLSDEKKSQPDAAGFVYRLMLAFPSWAGGILALYSIFMYRFNGLKIRPR
jgi:hypothetical protein